MKEVSLEVASRVSRLSLCESRSPVWILVAMILVASVSTGCEEELQMGGDPVDYYGEAGTTSEVSDHIRFSEVPYDFTGDMAIEDLRALLPAEDDQNVWLGFSAEDPYPVGGDCNPEFTGSETIPEALDELPAYIEGVVTLHPRYFENTTVCGSRERYYGTYILQDETTGIHILRNSRIGNFDVGDRVRLRVRGLTREHTMEAVLVFDNEEVLTDRYSRYAVHYEELDREFDADEDLYEVRRIRGEVIIEATNQNFNEMLIRSTEDPDIEWFASVDRELGTRGVVPRLGDVVQITAPVVDSFGLRMLIASLGKFEVIEEGSEE